MAIKGGGGVFEGFQDMHLREIQELTDTTQEELTEDKLIQMSASEPVPRDKKDAEAAVPENKLILDNLAEGFDYSRLLLSSFMT